MDYSKNKEFSFMSSLPMNNGSLHGGNSDRKKAFIMMFQVHVLTQLLCENKMIKEWANAVI